MDTPDKSESAESTPSASKRRPSRRKRRLFLLVLVTGSVLFAYYVCEAVYRVSVYRRLARAEFYPDVVTSRPMDMFDEHIGFRYIPNTVTRYRKFQDDGQPIPIDIEIRMNNQGHVSLNDDSVEKRDGEFRIAILGDSYAASLEMVKPWPDAVQEHLNADEDLKRDLGASSFKVINFAHDGIGLVQFAEIHRHEVARYDADLVMVNFIADDLFRRFHYRTTVPRDLGEFSYHLTVHAYDLPCSFDNPNSFPGTSSVADEDFADPEKRKHLRQDIAQLMTQRFRWFSPYPELLASRVGYRFGMPPKLFSSMAASRFQDRRQGFVKCVEAFRSIHDGSPESVFLFMPLGLYQIAGQVPPDVQSVSAAAPELRFVPMARYLPGGLGPDEIASWYVPGDGHLNDRGGAVYANAVYRMLKDYFPTIRSARQPKGE